MDAFLELENPVKSVISVKSVKPVKSVKSEKRMNTLKIKRNPKQEETNIISSLMTIQGLVIVGNKEDDMVVTASTIIKQPNIKKKRVFNNIEYESYQPIVKDNATVDFSS